MYSVIPLFRDSPFLSKVPVVPEGIEAALSFAMAVLLAFRINRAYERWWEARTLWGTLVNVSRNLAVKVRQLVDCDQEERRRMRDLIVAFSYRLKDHLQSKMYWKGLRRLPEPKPAGHHLPSLTVGEVYATFDRWHKEGRLSYEQMWILDREARVLLDVCGGCERIKNTLMSVSWRSLTQQCIVLYLLVLPWSLVNQFGVWTIPCTVVIAYIIISGEVLAYHIERPFGDTEDHVDLDAICATISGTVTEALVDDPVGTA